MIPPAAEDGERCKAAICFDEQTHVFDDDLAVDELQTIEIK